MTEFKITPEDVGRVAVDHKGVEWRILCVDGNYAFAASENGGDHAGYACNGSAEWSTDQAWDLAHWKPRLLEAPKRWWNVYRHGGYCLGYSHDTHKEADLAGAEYVDYTLVARVYAEHWHGCEEGRFDTPESIEGKES